MPYNSETSEYERRATTVIDATPDGDTVAVAIDVKLDQGIDDYIVDLNHHNANGNHFPATSVGSDSRFLKQSPAGVVSWADGVVAANAALKDFSNVANGAIAPAKIAQDASNRFTTDAEKAQWRGYNYIINGNFDIWQRGTSQTTIGYGSADRWLCGNTGSTKTASQQAFTLGQTDVPGNPKYYMRHVVTSVAGANNYCVLQHRIEGVGTFAAKKATLSFWAKVDAPKNIAIEFAQYFGTGGTPSATFYGISAQKIALTTSWKKYTITVDIPSISGKVSGSNLNDYLQLNIWFDAGSAYAARSANLGQQSGTFDIACVSLVEGDIDIKPIPRSYGEELALCQMYYQNVSFSWRGYLPSGLHAKNTIQYPVVMRATPTMSVLYIENINTWNNEGWLGLTAYIDYVSSLIKSGNTSEVYVTSVISLDAEI